MAKILLIDWRGDASNMTVSFLYHAMQQKDMSTSYRVLTLGADPGDLSPFEKYANAMLSLGNPASAGRAKHRARGLPGAGRRWCPRSAIRQRRTGRWLAREEPATGLSAIADKSSLLP